MATQLHEPSPEYSELDKQDQERIKSLVSRYYRQIRYGCGNQSCQTPTCLSFERRHASGAPYRRPTVLSARAMAACLAMAPNPASKLCPHGQSESTDPSDCAFPGDAGEITEELDSKSLVQMLFNSRTWRHALMSPVATTLTGQGWKLGAVADSLGHELRTNPAGVTASHLCAAMDTLCDFLPRFDTSVDTSSDDASLWRAWVELRRRGRYLLDPVASRRSKNKSVAMACRELADAYQDENALRLLRHMLTAFATMTYNKEMDITGEDELLGFLARDSDASLPETTMRPPCWHSDRPKRIAPTAEAVLEWCRVMLQHEWDNKPVFSWSSMVGCAIEFLNFLHTHRTLLQLDQRLFEMPYLFKRTDFMEIPRSWMDKPVPENHAHMLSFPWLFPVSSLVTYFRVVNHLMMSNAVNASASLQYLIHRHRYVVEPHDDQIVERLRTAMGQLLVLEIHRHNILEDAMNELWRRQKRELRRPLKVRMGMDEGEEGVDFGGVQQEFFRLSLSEALDPDYGLFTTDETTRMTWFLPCSKAPLHHFTLIGILVGLAVYNGITLSVTFPEALYRKLLGEPVSSLEHIADGWPTLTKGLRHLLDFEDGDVADMFMRSYVFSAETNGTVVSADMANHQRDEPWPGPCGPEDSNAVEETAGLVTTENRERFVEDYVFWLTDKSVRPQYEAFATGFFLCIDKQPLRLFEAVSLRTLVEGYQRVDVDGLQRTASYDNGYNLQHGVIQWFWEIVRNFSAVEVRKLLEFVTASDRVPAKGIEEIVFIIQRNGSDDERLPTSQTCFGRLLLPEYSTREILEDKLRQAMVHSLGFYLQ